jgi:hypothetical protein
LDNSAKGDSNTNMKNMSKMNHDFNGYKKTKSNNDNKNDRSKSPTANSTSGSDTESHNNNKNKNNNENKISNYNNPFIHLYYSHFSGGIIKDDYVKVKLVNLICGLMPI